MGLRKEYTDFVKENAVLYQKTLLELGNSVVRDPIVHNNQKTGKNYFGSVGCLHISMDLNGFDGAIVHDLGKTVKGFDNFFDVVLNCGFSVYVKNYEMCYQNIFNMCKPGGLMIYILPMVGSKWVANHYVNEKFFANMAEKFSCTIEKFEFIHSPNGPQAAVVMKKLTNKEFKAIEKENKSKTKKTSAKNKEE